MNKIKLTVRFLTVLFLLVVTTVIWIQPNSATDCETQRIDDFWAANDSFTLTFNSWHFDTPTSCYQECTDQCNVPNPPTGCVNTCANVTCPQTRYDSFVDAQDNLVDVGNRVCPHDPDFCDAARAANDMCNLVFQNQLNDPVYYPNTTDIDQEWHDWVFAQGQACVAASGIDKCR